MDPSSPINLLMPRQVRFKVYANATEIKIDTSAEISRFLIITNTYS